MRCFSLLALLILALSACAPRLDRPGSASTPRDKPAWAFEASDIEPEREYRFGKLANGMRYVVRRNENPRGTALVRMLVETGSLDESDNERGFAHYVEHMAFNGSSNVPEGEMVRLLQRHGLAFGADTNASTSFETTTYMLDLPKSDPELLGIALMLMRETASELAFTPEAVERERGVVLAEMRDRNTWQLHNAKDQAKFLFPAAHYPERFPIGTAETLQAATASALKAFWRREYTPAKTTLVVVGDFDARDVERMLRERFESWQSAGDGPQPSAGPVAEGDAGRTGMHLDQALSERLMASRHGKWRDEPDTVANRREGLLRQIGYGVVNRRLQRVSRQSDPPFRDAGFGTGDMFQSGRSSNLVVDTADGKWQRGLSAAVREYRRALQFGFAQSEIAEQVANLRTALENGAAAAATRSNGTLVNAVFGLLRDDTVPSSPKSALDRFKDFVPKITPARVLAALKRDAVPLDRPLLRLQGRKAPEGGAPALRKAWNEAVRAPVTRQSETTSSGFAYTNFGPPGRVVSDEREPKLGIRTLRFANGVRLNLKRTELEKDTVRLQVSVDGGDMLATRAKPLVTQMVPMLTYGGLGKHSLDDLQTVLAGHTLANVISPAPDSFVASAQTTPRDLELQLQLTAATLSDAGYRTEGEVRFRLNINNHFQRLRATPAAALGNAVGGIVSDNDPRFTLQPIEDYRKLTFGKLKADLADRFARGAIEIGMVGNFDEGAAIAAVSRTLGALPQREPEFRPYAENRQRSFTARRGLRVLRHDGETDQALLHLIWPSRDDSNAEETRGLALLERLARIQLLESIREKLGKAYAPSAESAPSRTWPGYGTFSVTVSTALTDVPAMREAARSAIASLRDAPIGEDLLQRARQPMVEALDNALKNNGGWLALVDRAQTEAGRIERYLAGKAQLLAQTPARLQALAQRWLDPAAAVEVLVLPEGATAPAR